jgi:hypothetical protein
LDIVKEEFDNDPEFLAQYAVNQQKSS